MTLKRVINDTKCLNTLKYICYNSQPIYCFPQGIDYFFVIKVWCS